MNADLDLIDHHGRLWPFGGRKLADLSPSELQHLRIWQALIEEVGRTASLGLSALRLAETLEGQLDGLEERLP